MLTRVVAFTRARVLRLPGVSSKLSREVGWLVIPYGAQQVLRLVTNIVLTRLLAPEIFGVMLLINSLRTGTELLSDIGIGQSVVRSRNGDDRDFLDSAWTLQVLRGLLLTLFALLATAPIAALYDRPDLAPLILAVSPIFLFTGLQSAGLFVAQRRMQLRRRAIYETASTIINSVISIGLALFIKSAWALVIALVAGTLVTTMLSFVVFERRLPRFHWEAAHFREIISFGKWIFLSTAIYFAATSYDRLYLVAALPIALAGIYSIARTASDILAALAHRGGTFLVFPRAAAAHNEGGDVGHQLRGTRRRALALVAVVTGLAVAASDQFILLAYDERYHAAAFMIPILVVSVWFYTLSAFADSMLMGVGRPAPGAWANAAKFAVMLIGLPLAMAQGNLLTALLVLLLAEVARWAALLPASLKHRFARISDDLQLTLGMAAVALVAKFGLGFVGLVPTIGEWWALKALIHV